MAAPSPEVAASPEDLRWAPALWTGLWGLCAAIALATRPLLPVDETRYLAVAWEMWLRGDFLLPRLNGELYSHKPPALFWLMHAGWWLAGVSEWWPRLLSPLAALANLFLSGALARALWPERPSLARLAPLLLSGCLLWTAFGTLVLFDMLLTTAVLVALLGVARAWRGGGVGAWLLVAAGLGAGALIKGPVVLLPALPVALLAPWWALGPRPARWSRWYLGVGAAVVLAHVIALAWAVPAARAGGAEYGRAILFGQTAGRLLESFAHRRAWWWYLPWLPVAFYPFLFWRPLWRGFGRLRRLAPDPGLRFCLAWALPAFLALSAVSGKQEHYLLPLFPAFALIAALGLSLDQNRKPFGYPWGPWSVFLVLAALFLGIQAYARRHPTTGLAGDLAVELGGWLACGLLAAAALLLALPARRLERQILVLGLHSLALFGIVHLALAAGGGRAYDLRPMAERLRVLEERGVPVAHARIYHGQFQFVGRLRRPLAVILPGSERRWLKEHPGGRVVAYSHGEASPAGLPEAEFRQPFRGQTVGLYAAPPPAGGG